MGWLVVSLPRNAKGQVLIYQATADKLLSLSYAHPIRNNVCLDASHNPSPSHSDCRRERSVAILKSILFVLATKGSDRRLFLQALGSYCVQALGPSLESISCRRHLATHHIIFISACESGFMDLLCGKCEIPPTGIFFLVSGP